MTQRREVSGKKGRGGRLTVIGVTGGIGSGKTCVVEILKELGAEVVNADEVGHRVILPGTMAWGEIVETWGKDVLSPDGTIDRSKLGAFVFGDRKELEKLNRISHPRIRQALEDEIEKRRRDENGGGVLVVEAAVLIEAGWHTLVDQVWVVVSDREEAAKRISLRNGLPVQKVWERIRSQIADDERIKHATVIIRNDGSLDDLKERVLEAWRAHVQGRPA